MTVDKLRNDYKEDVLSLFKKYRSFEVKDFEFEQSVPVLEDSTPPGQIGFIKQSIRVKYLPTGIERTYDCGGRGSNWLRNFIDDLELKIFISG